MDFHNVWGPFRARDLSWLNSEERIYCVSFFFFSLLCFFFFLYKIRFLLGAM